MGYFMSGAVLVLLFSTHRGHESSKVVEEGPRSPAMEWVRMQGANGPAEFKPVEEKEDG
jgi:hypothetical protein